MTLAEGQGRIGQLGAMAPQKVQNPPLYLMYILHMPPPKFQKALNRFSKF